MEFTMRLPLFAVVLCAVFRPPLVSNLLAEDKHETPAASERATGSFTIPAWAFDRGNVRVFTSNWADVEPMVAHGGVYPNDVSYDIPVPSPANYKISIRYSAAASRPVDLYFGEDKIGQACKAATGGWNTSRAHWEVAATRWIAPGKHTLRLKRQDGPFPHIVAIKFEADAAFPDGWKLDRPHARKLTDPPPAAPSARFVSGKVDAEALRLAIEDLTTTFGDRYARGDEFAKRLAELANRREQLQANKASDEEIEEAERDLRKLHDEALRANPLLDFNRLLLVRRRANAPKLGLPQNWQSNSCLSKSGYDDAIVSLSPVSPEGELTEIYKPKDSRFVGDVDLHFDADKILFSSPGQNGRWQVCEIKVDGSGYREITGDQPDVDSYDACYLPNGKIIVTSTACFIGVPCVYGSSHVTNTYVMDADGKNIRQLTFDQEHNWCPTVMANGRVLYTRWEYADTPHSNTRLLFHMNPDGTEQMEYYGSNSYWPNSFFYTRPIPGHPTKVVSVIGGHHDNPRMGELVVFDPAEGRREAAGAVQRIPGRDEKVEPIIKDGLTRSSWPKFLHPYPLSEKYFLVACKLSPQSLWGIYLVDTFDNFVLIKEQPNWALLEPIPLRKTPRPPVIPEKVDLTKTTATVYIADIYHGDGLKDAPRGSVKALRLFSYHFSYQGMGGLLGIVGMDGPWDIKRVLGTVPVYPDGSAKFEVPANTPISIQPLDEDGQAMQLMRSWMTAMPGEVVSCVGCHESQNSTPTPKPTYAIAETPDEIEPWYGETRGFSYPREVQPVIDKFCVGCHNGEDYLGGDPLVNLRGDQKIDDWGSTCPGNGGKRSAGRFSVGYANLHRYVRRPGIESDYHMLEPLEYHASTTQLVQMLRKGHYGVKMSDEAWDRLITWIDLNCPYHGTWHEELKDPGVQRQRRRDLLKLYANIDVDHEWAPPAPLEVIEPIIPKQVARPTTSVNVPNWPFDAEAAIVRQAAAEHQLKLNVGDENLVLDLGQGQSLKLSLIPAGQFVMGSDTRRFADEPQRPAEIERPFWMGTTEITNAQFAVFDPKHDSRVESKNAYQFGIHGYPMNEPDQPVVRVTHQQATAFCQWLSKKTGKRVSLPSEVQWEWACRAGAETPFWYGDEDADFGPYANLADTTMTLFATNPYTVFTPLKNPPKYDDWIPKDARFNDNSLLSVPPAKYEANAWGLFDMHGNVAEWTSSPYDAEQSGATAMRVVRGGSWRDRPHRATASFRLPYRPYQKIYNVGFRVIVDTE
jgi:formylglycine-generating enzyme required for sulfatase activity